MLSISRPVILLVLITMCTHVHHSCTSLQAALAQSEWACIAVRAQSDQDTAVMCTAHAAVDMMPYGEVSVNGIYLFWLARPSHLIAGGAEVRDVRASGVKVGRSSKLDYYNRGFPQSTASFIACCECNGACTREVVGEITMHSLLNRHALEAT